MEGQRKILMLGGSAQQCPVISRAKEMGIYTVLCDYLPDNPGRLIADKYYPCSTTDVEAVYEVAKREEVDGILAYASDPAALPAAIVCERLGLPTNPVSAVETLSLKHKFRQFQKDHGLPHPRFVAFSADEKPDLSSLKFPIIIKPTDSSGSKGVTVVHSPKHLQFAIAKGQHYSRNQILIAEEFLQWSNQQQILSIEIFIIDDEIKLFAPMRSIRKSFNDNLVPMGEIFPSAQPQNLISDIRETIQNIINVCNIRMGEMNIEVLIDPIANRHCILDFGCRAGGNMIPQFISMATNTDLLEANINAALNTEITLTPQAVEGYYMYYILYNISDGLFREIEVSEEIKKHIIDINLYHAVGSRIRRLRQASDAIGIAFLKADTYCKIQCLADTFDENIRVKQIDYKINSCSISEFISLISICQSSFSSPLLSKPDIGYINKLYQNSTIFEAWNDNDLIAAICAYINKDLSITYIPLVCTAPGFRQKGICLQLLENIENFSANIGIKNIDLEVYNNNYQALSVYRRFKMETINDKCTKDKTYLRKRLGGV